MKLSIENTTKIVQLNGVPARVWEGTTSSGIPVICYITRVQVDRDANQSLFLQELDEQREPSPAAAAIPARLVL